jgi:hypothetical protein
MLIFPRELETHVYGQEGVIYFEQFDGDGNRTTVIRLSIHQFQEIFNRQKIVVAEAREEQEDVQ